MLYIQSRQNQIQFQLEHVTIIECVYIRIEITHFQTKKKEKENYALSEFNLLSTCPQIIVLRGTDVSLPRVKMRPHSIHDQLLKASEVLAGFFSRTQSDERAEIKWPLARKCRPRTGYAGKYKRQNCSHKD